jgi:hypothetical protein
VDAVTARAIVEDDAGAARRRQQDPALAALPGVELDAVIEVQRCRSRLRGARLWRLKTNLSLASRAPTSVEHPSGPRVDLIGTRTIQASSGRFWSNEGTSTAAVDANNVIASQVTLLCARAHRLLRATDKDFARRLLFLV